jgi:hypothetical protein
MLLFTRIDSTLFAKVSHMQKHLTLHLHVDPFFFTLSTLFLVARINGLSVLPQSDLDIECAPLNLTLVNICKLVRDIS